MDGWLAALSARFARLGLPGLVVGGPCRTYYYAPYIGMRKNYGRTIDSFSTCGVIALLLDPKVSCYYSGLPYKIETFLFHKPGQSGCIKQNK